MFELIWSFAPWLVFLVVDRFATLEDAAACALAAAVIVLVRALIHAHLHLLDVASTIYFVALLAVVLATDSADHVDISNYAQAGAHAALTLITFGSVVVGHPFTESYARETVPREYWHSDRFRALNRQISLAWSLAFLIGTISLVIAANTDEYPVLLRIIVPFGALYWAYTITERLRKPSEATPANPTAAAP